MRSIASRIAVFAVAVLALAAWTSPVSAARQVPASAAFNLAQVLDRYEQASAPAPDELIALTAMAIDGRLLASLDRSAPEWLAANGPTGLGRRRLTLAAFVLEVLSAERDRVANVSAPQDEPRFLTADAWSQQRGIHIGPLGEPNGPYGFFNSFSFPSDSNKGAYPQRTATEWFNIGMDVADPGFTGRISREVRYLGHVLVGRAGQWQGRWTEAEAAYRAALVAVPDARTAAIALARLLDSRGSQREADAILARLKDPAPPDPWLLFEKGDLMPYAALIQELRRAVR